MEDMRQPLAGVQAASALLSVRVTDDEEARFLVSAITAACHMLLGMVTNVLSVRTLETGECRAENAPFSARHLIESVLSVCRMSTAHRSNVRLLWPDEADASLPALVLGDERLLSSCFLNLCTNAIKFCDASDIIISARYELGVLTLTVTDGGRGTSVEECVRVFEPYFCSPSHRGGGTGLGLFICKRFVEAMSGTVSVESMPGQGARFTICVPAAAVDAPPAPLLTLPAQSSPTISPGASDARVSSPPLRNLIPRRDGRPLRTLLVDDHGLNRKLLSKLLELHFRPTCSRRRTASAPTPA